MKLFRQYLHTSPIDYLISYRLKQAAKLLTTTRGSVSAIAEQTGFENVGYFCRKFKAVFSQTPSQYRRESQEP
nr:helix-turn-helix transcriptional regulator [Pseudoflavonifractor sp. MSJ-30]